MKKFLIRLCVFFIIAFFVVWGISILKCEIETYRYGWQFEDIYQGHTMIGEIDCLKILNYTNTNARVYYVSKDHSGGDVLEFYRENDGWCFDNWNTVWSKSGSADGFIWPYIR